MNQSSLNNTLLLRLTGPMQSWGTRSRFAVRDTGLEPSKSGVIGLICAALGRPRSAPIKDLAALKMGVRVDREGVMAYDFQTAQNILKASGGLKDTEISNRYYLADANFLVGFQGDKTLLEDIQAALHNPYWPLFLGRKAFVPSTPIWLADGLHPDQDLLTTLQQYPWQAGANQKEPTRLRLSIEDHTGSEVRNDNPLSFQSNARRFSLRRIKTRWMPLPEKAGDL